MKTLLYLFILLGAAAPFNMFGQQEEEHVLLAYYFDASGDWSPSVEDSELVAGTNISPVGVNVVGFGNGVDGLPDMAPYSNQWPSTPMNPIQYYEFPVIGAPDKISKVTKMKVYVRYMTGGPGTFTVRSDAGGDNFSSNLYQQSNAAPVNWQFHNVNLFIPPIVDGEDVTFRLYAGGGGSVGTWAIDSLKIVGYEMLSLSARTFLEGPLDGSLMDDALRTNGQIPVVEPYSALEFPPTENPGAAHTPTALTNDEDDAIVDWVLVELRSASNPTVVVASEACLLERDGDIVALDGYRRPAFDVPIDPYYVAIWHRNHLPVMTANPVPPGILIDFTSMGTATWGTDAQVDMGGVLAMHSGDVNMDGSVKYTGIDNDRDLILVRVGSTVPNNVEIGYYTEDVNMDGSVKYTGIDNDRDAILVNLGGTTPNNVRTEQLP